MAISDKPKDWAKVGSVAFVIALIGIMVANQFVEGFSLPIRTVMFIVFVGVALYISFQLIGEAKRTGEISFMDVILYGIVLVGIGYLIVKFNISPNFSIALESLIP